MRPGNGEGLSVETLAGESREAFRTSDLDKRLNRYGSARENALKFRRYLVEQQEDKLADALGDCGNYATFRDYFTIGQTRLSRICTCKKHLLCPLCAIRRGAKALRVYLARVEHLRAADASLRAFLVTLTVKNGDDLGERFVHLSSNVRRYHKLRHLNRGHEVCKATSSVWSYEFTNRGKGWHPHVHAVWLGHEAPDPFKLAREWQDLTGDSYIVDVRPLDDADPVAAFCEVFKYALKFSDLADPDRLHAYRTLKGKRLQDSFGDLRGLDVEPSDSDEILDDLPYIERLYRFVEGQGYVLHNEKTVSGKTDDDRMLEALIGMGWPDDQIVSFMRERGERHAA